MPGPALTPNPVMSWLQEPSVMDSKVQKALRMVASLLGADDPSQVMLQPNALVGPELSAIERSIGLRKESLARVEDELNRLARQADAAHEGGVQQMWGAPPTPHASMALVYGQEGYTKALAERERLYKEIAKYERRAKALKSQGKK